MGRLPRWPSRGELHVSVFQRFLHSHSPPSSVFCAGGDASFIFWDHISQQRLVKPIKKHLPVTALSYNRTGQYLAYALGYDWERVGLTCTRISEERGCLPKRRRC